MLQDRRTIIAAANIWILFAWRCVSFESVDLFEGYLCELYLFIHSFQILLVFLTGAALISVRLCFDLAALKVVLYLEQNLK